MERNILRKKTTINGVPYEPIILPGILKDYVLMLAHNEQGHNGFRRTYKCTEMHIPLEGNEGCSKETLHQVHYLCKTQYEGAKAQKGTL